MWSGFAAMEAAKRDIIERKSHRYNLDPPPPYEVTPIRYTPVSSRTTKKKHKDKIPRAVRNAVWVRYFPNSLTGVCVCCKIEGITYGNFQAGHVISEHNGGSTTIDNLRPVCALCNTSMGTQNMDDFISKYGF
jgi:5-methylcytosine-specific restriction endonuclease McrA